MKQMTFGDKVVMVSEKIADAIQQIQDAPRGGYACVKGYVSKTDYVVPRISNIVFNACCGTFNHYERELEVLKGLNVETLAFEDKELLEKARQELIASREKTLSGDRSDARRQAWDTFTIKVTDGIMLQLKTRKEGSETVLETVDGVSIAESIRLTALESGRRIIQEGEKKVVKHRPLTIAKNFLEKIVSKEVRSIITLSLKDDNFDSLSMNGEQVMA